MKNIKKFDSFLENLENDGEEFQTPGNEFDLDNNNDQEIEFEDDYEAGEEFEVEDEANIHSELSSAVNELCDALDRYESYEEGEEDSQEETTSHFDLDESELTIIDEMKTHAEELKRLLGELNHDEIIEEEEPEGETMENEYELAESFASVSSKIAKKQDISKKRASAILASSTRKASPEAKAKNPKLKKVRGA